MQPLRQRPRTTLIWPPFKRPTQVHSNKRVWRKASPKVIRFCGAHLLERLARNQIRLKTDNRTTENKTQRKSCAHLEQAARRGEDFALETNRANPRRVSLPADERRNKVFGSRPMLKRAVAAKLDLFIIIVRCSRPPDAYCSLLVSPPTPLARSLEILCKSDTLLASRAT